MKTVAVCLARMELTAKRLRELLHYEPETGIFTRISSRMRTDRIGKCAGYLKKDGYVYIKIDGVGYLAHRLAWLFITGSWPRDEIDHADLNKSNNRWSNLRSATHSQNLANTKSKRNMPKGVYKTAQNISFSAVITHKGKRIHIGTFRSIKDAHLAYQKEAARLHKDFARFK